MATEARNTTDRVENLEGLPQEEREDAFPPTEGVYGHLFKAGYHFSFFQAVRLLEKYFPDAPAPGETWDARRDRIRFRPHNALVFPAADIKRIEAVEASETSVSKARLVVTFLGLYGVDAPLPVYFYDDLAAERPGTDALRDFLDIFNHRLYAYFYRAWKKYRPDVGYGTPGKDPNARRFLSVAGLGTRGAVAETPLPDPMRLAAFARWIAPHARHSEGLRKLLSEIFVGLTVQVKENTLRWVPLPMRPRMGRGGGFDLGSGAVIGRRVPDRSGMFRLIIGLLDFENYLAFRPGKEKARLLVFLVRLYVPDYLDYEVELHLDTSKVPPIRLGKGDVQLGMTTWLGRPRQPVIKIPMTY